MKIENFRISEGDPHGSVMGISPINMQLSISDLKLLELSEINERAIYAAFGLTPPEKEQFDKM